MVSEPGATTYEALAVLAEELAGTGSRLLKRAAIAKAIARAASPETTDAGLFAQYLAGLPFAEADPRKLNAGGALLSRAVMAVSGASDAQLTAAYRRHGDMGSAAFDLLAPLRAGQEAAKELPLREVERIFAAMAGAATTAIRAELVRELLGRASAVGAKYLLKLMLGDMRIGVKESLVEEAIAVAAGVEVAAVRHAVMLEADLAGAGRRAFAGTLGEARMRLFHPLGFMLASPVETPEEAIARFTEKPKKAPAVKTPKKRKTARGSSAPDDVPEGVPADAASADEDPEEFADVAVLDTIAVPVENKADAELSAAAATGEQGIGPVQAFLEDKYDGMRAQVHCGDVTQPGRVAIYSRNREDITESFPELVEAFARVEETAAGALILDGEILGWDYAGGDGEDGGRALPFAVMGQRIGRKRVDNALRRSVPVVFMAFDLLFSEGELRLELPLRERRARLEAIAAAIDGVTRSPLELPEVPKPVKRGRGKAVAQEGLFAVAEEPAPGVAGELMPRLLLSPARLVESAEAIDTAYGEARARANEGVMLKAAGSAYLPGRRGLAWVKLKRELATLDVVITGAEYGSGRKSQFLSDYTFAVRGEGGELLNVGKAYSGVTDLEIAELTEWLRAHTLEDFGHFRTVEPAVILEVAFNNIMRSDRHASGFALRFPRILRIRTDKPLAEIDTVARVEEVYQSQVDKPAQSAADTAD